MEDSKSMKDNALTSDELEVISIILNEKYMEMRDGISRDRESKDITKFIKLSGILAKVNALSFLKKVEEGSV